MIKEHAKQIFMDYIVEENTFDVDTESEVIY